MVHVVESFGNLNEQFQYTYFIWYFMSKNRFGANGGAGSKGQMGMKL